MQVLMFDILLRADIEYRLCHYWMGLLYSRRSLT